MTNFCLGCTVKGKIVCKGTIVRVSLVNRLDWLSVTG